VSLLAKTLSTKLIIRHRFGFVWKAQKMMKVWSCECLQRRCCDRKVVEGLVNQTQPTWKCELELCLPQRPAGMCNGL